MNKSIITGVLGFILGAAGGSAVTYYIVNEQRDEEMDAYAEHTEKRIERLRKKLNIDLNTIYGYGYRLVWVKLNLVYQNN